MFIFSLIEDLVTMYVAGVPMEHFFKPLNLFMISFIALIFTIISEIVEEKLEKKYGINMSYVFKRKK